MNGLLSRDEAGDGGLGDETVGDADARVGGLHHRRLMQVYPRVGEHLVGQGPLLLGSGKFGNPWLRRQRANASSAAICA